MNPEVIGGFPKGKTRKQLKAKAGRAEAKVKKAVRAEVDARDGYCFIAKHFPQAKYLGDAHWHCEGMSEWCHRHSHRRSQTRGQAPESRHTTAASFKGCTKHHDMYDGRRRPRLRMTMLTRHGFNGQVRASVVAK